MPCLTASVILPLANWSNRLNAWATRLGHKSPFVDLYNGIYVFGMEGKQWQTTDSMHWQPYHEQHMKAVFDCLPNHSVEVQNTW